MNDSLATADCAHRTGPSPADVSLAQMRSRILIIENEALVAESLADLVNDAGFLALGPAATAAEAAQMLDQGRPHAAILDIVLRDGMETRVAIELASRGIPFIVYWGCRRDRCRCPSSPG
jgi:DNA-binding NtrC family response regulator